MKLVHDGQWVKVLNLMNKRFYAAHPCSICLSLKCAPVWYSIQTGEVRCLKCWSPTDART
jgi:hypothetical protein